MGKNSCSCQCGCTTLSVIAGVVIGIITAILTYTATIAITPAFLWVTLGIAVVYLAVLLTTAPVLPERSCICKTVGTTLTGILGAALFALILLGVSFAATSLLGAIFAGVLLFFLSLTVSATACLIKCTLGCTECGE